MKGIDRKRKEKLMLWNNGIRREKGWNMMNVSTNKCLDRFLLLPLMGRGERVF
jgi:hypothetical protein